MLWKTMAEWRSEGPPNGTEMLVLLSDGRRIVASFDGLSLSWTCGGQPVAWCEIPEAPTELANRNALIEQKRKQLDELERAPLEIR